MALCSWIAWFQSWCWWIIPIFVPFLIFRLKKHVDRSRKQSTVAFFHPYCNAGGGGERVLWEMVKIVQDDFRDKQVGVYTGDKDVSPQDILTKVFSNFRIELQPTIQFVFLSQQKWVEASRYPYFTLVSQSLGSLILCLDAIIRFTPDYFIDSVGYSWTYPLVKILCGSKVCCYTHYPTISTDMLDIVASAIESFNNRSFIAKSPFLTKMKTFYYRCFALVYGWAGRWSDLIVVNSSWTKEHIDKLWSSEDRTFLVYPPCDTSAFVSLKLSGKIKGQMISVAQFRPEKNHEMQLKAFRLYLDKMSSNTGLVESSKLVLIGSSRNEEDDERVNQLRTLARKLGLEEKVEIRVNITFQELLTFMEKSTIGIHSMTNEHFGISVVEMMAAGVVTIAHASGGPKLDIIVNSESGFLASSEEEYAEIMIKIVSMNDEQINQIQKNARKRVDTFSQRAFRDRMLPLLKTYFEQ